VLRCTITKQPGGDSAGEQALAASITAATMTDVYREDPLIAAMGATADQVILRFAWLRASPRASSHLRTNG
jgi:hypothetical protein